MTHRGPFQPLTFCDSVKCKVPHLGRKNPMQQDVLGTDWLQSSFAPKGPGDPGE